MTTTRPVSLRGVSKRYRKDLLALDGATLELEPGSRVCLLGPNGAGKTTLLRILTGALGPTSGVVELFGASPGTAAFDLARKRVGFVPQAPGAYRDLTTRQYLTFVRDVYGRGDVTAIERALGLDAHADKPMSALSGGWHRKLVLGAALVGEPELLLFDEPTVGLDPIATREVHALLRRAMEGRTTLLCTHNLAEAEALCDTVAILASGRILAYERIDRLKAALPARLFLRAEDGSTEFAAHVERAGFAVSLEGRHVVVETPNADARAKGLVAMLVSEGVALCECRVEEPSLEELFVHLLGDHRAE